MKPSSSISELRGGLFDGVLARGEAAAAVNDPAWLQAMLDVEGALARAEARAGRFDARIADAISSACSAGGFDVAAIGRDAADSGNPVVPLVRALTAAVDDPAAAAHVHEGATSQDVLDTAAMLVASRALGPLVDDLAAAADAAAALAAAHRATPMAGRTLLQQALPTTFGLKAAGWLTELDRAAARLVEVRRTGLAVQFGGAVGTTASLGADGVAVMGFLADELELSVPAMPWHTDRTRIGELAGALGVAAGAIAKPARDVVLLAQTEVGEVRERTSGRGGSSTLPQKRNPIAAVAAIGCAAAAPGLVATLLASMVQEHERAAGAWHAEWKPLADLVTAVGSAAVWLRECLTDLEVDEARMRSNLDLTGGLLLAERIVAALAPALGRLAAHDLVEEACRQAVEGDRALADVLAERREVSAQLAPGEIADLLDPLAYLGSADAFVERALEAHRAPRGTDAP